MHKCTAISDCQSLSRCLDGWLTVPELQELMSLLGWHHGKQQVPALVDTSSQGNICYSDFLQVRTCLTTRPCLAQSKYIECERHSDLKHVCDYCSALVKTGFATVRRHCFMRLKLLMTLAWQQAALSLDL